LNTDDRPLLSYTTYGATFRPTIADNLVRMLACRGEVSRFVRNPEDRGTMLRHFAASNEALLGHIAYQMGNDAEALRHYVEGAKLLEMNDPAFEQLVFASWRANSRRGRNH
jgi:hypothetical protein